MADFLGFRIAFEKSIELNYIELRLDGYTAGYSWKDIEVELFVDVECWS